MERKDCGDGDNPRGCDGLPLGEGETLERRRSPWKRAKPLHGEGEAPGRGRGYGHQAEIDIEYAYRLLDVTRCTNVESMLAGPIHSMLVPE